MAPRVGRLPWPTNRASHGQASAPGQCGGPGGHGFFRGCSAPQLGAVFPPSAAGTQSYPHVVPPDHGHRSQPFSRWGRRGWRLQWHQRLSQARGRHHAAGSRPPFTTLVMEPRMATPTPPWRPPPRATLGHAAPAASAGRASRACGLVSHAALPTFRAATFPRLREACSLDEAHRHRRVPRSSRRVLCCVTTRQWRTCLNPPRRCHGNGRGGPRVLPPRGSHCPPTHKAVHIECMLFSP